MPNHAPEQYPSKEKMLMVVILAPIYEDLSQSEKNSEINPPLIDAQYVFLQSAHQLNIKNVAKC